MRCDAMRGDGMGWDGCGRGTRRGSEKEVTTRAHSARANTTCESSNGAGILRDTLTGLRKFTPTEGNQTRHSLHTSPVDCECNKTCATADSSRLANKQTNKQKHKNTKTQTNTHKKHTNTHTRTHTHTHTQTKKPTNQQTNQYT